MVCIVLCICDGVLPPEWADYIEDVPDSSRTRRVPVLAIGPAPLQIGTRVFPLFPGAMWCKVGLDLAASCSGLFLSSASLPEFRSASRLIGPADPLVGDAAADIKDPSYECPLFVSDDPGEPWA